MSRGFLSTISGWDATIFKLKEYSKAIQCFTTSIEMEPRLAHGRYWLGRTYLKQKSYSDALSNISDAIEINPDEPSYYIRKIRVLIESGNFDQAMEQIGPVTEIILKDRKLAITIFDELKISK